MPSNCSIYESVEKLHCSPEHKEWVLKASIDNSRWVVGRIIVEYYLRGNPSQINKRLFNSYREFSCWISNSVTAQEVRMLTTKHEIIYPNEMQGACCIYKW